MVQKIFIAQNPDNARLRFSCLKCLQPQNFIDFFIADTGVKKFDDSDTRTFLYEELFGDMKSMN